MNWGRAGICRAAPVCWSSEQEAVKRQGPQPAAPHLQSRLWGAALHSPGHVDSTRRALGAAMQLLPRGRRERSTVLMGVYNSWMLVLPIYRTRSHRKASIKPRRGYDRCRSGRWKADGGHREVKPGLALLAVEVLKPEPPAQAGRPVAASCVLALAASALGILCRAHLGHSPGF